MEKVFEQIIRRAGDNDRPRLIVHSLADGVIRVEINASLRDELQPVAIERMRQVEQLIKDRNRDVQVWQ